MLSSLRKLPGYRFAADLYHDLKNSSFKGKKGTDYYCPVCKSYWKSFRPIPHEWLTPLFASGWPYRLKDPETLNYENYACYGCGITDRDRLYILYFQKMLKGGSPLNVIEFAPTPPLSRFLRSVPGINLRTSDLYNEAADDMLDLQDLHKYSNNSFDIFICSHILEHVDDDIKAMKELHRILKPGGFGIAMVPIIPSVQTTVEDPSITDENTRMKLFGQKDHVRLYAKQDFISRLQSVGFKVQLHDEAYFGEEKFREYGITRKSVLYIVHK